MKIAGDVIAQFAAWRDSVRRGEALLAPVGLGLAAVIVGTLIAGSAWVSRAEQRAAADAHAASVRQAAEALAPAVAQVASASGAAEASVVLSDALRRGALQSARLLSPSGEVLADGDLSSAVGPLPEAGWDAGSADPGEARVQRLVGTVVVTVPVRVGELGPAVLRVQAEPWRGAGTWSAQVGWWLIGAGELLGLGGVLFLFGRRLRAAAWVRGALLATGQGVEPTGGALLVDDSLGFDAAPWNEFVRRWAVAAEAAAVKRARSTGPGAPASSGADLAAGCDAMAQGLLLIDGGLRVRYANHAAAVFLRSDREKVQGHPLDELALEEAVREAAREAASGRVQRRCALEVQREQGQGVLRFVVYPVTRGQGSLALVAIEDITQQRVAEQSRHDFVTQATHELRTPLTNIKLYVDMAAEDGENNPVVRAECLNVINQEANRLDRMVGEMLSVAEIEAGSLRLNHDDVRLAELLEQLELDYKAQAMEKQITLTFRTAPKLPVIQGDRDKLLIAVHNLLGNALKYTEPGGRVSLSTEANDNGVVIEVTDSGIGISPEDADRVFEKFYRAPDKRVAGIPGTGLGLALSREVVRLHGGEVTLESRLDQGSTFTITLPLGEPGVSAAAA